MEIAHETSIALSGNATPEQIQDAERLIVAADAACMVGNLLRTAGLRFRVSGAVLTLADE